MKKLRELTDFTMHEVQPARPSVRVRVRRRVVRYCPPYLGGASYKTRNPKPETRNSKFENRNPKPETQSPKAESRNPEPGARNPKPEPKPQTRTPETRNPKPEIRNPKPEIRMRLGPGGGWKNLTG